MMHGEVYSVQKLGSVLESGNSGILLLDCRGPNEFNTSHIQGSLHVLIPNLLLRRLKKGNLTVASVVATEVRDSFLSRWQKDLVVLYDDRSRGNDLCPTSEVSLLLQKLTKDGCRTCLLQGGFLGFQQEFPHLCTGTPSPSDDQTIIGLRNLNLRDFSSCPEKQPSPPSNTNVFPVQVLPYLYLGNAQNSEDMSCLTQHGIKYVINVTPNVENKFEGCSDIKYLQIPIDDHWSQTIAPFFQKAIAFIEEGRNAQQGVLVHCLAGISRSVTVTVAYLMYALKFSLNEAYDFVRTKKSNISPNFNFMGQLLDFEKTLLAKDCGCSCAKEAAMRETKVVQEPQTVGSVPASSSTTTSSSSSTVTSSLSTVSSSGALPPPSTSQSGTLPCLCSCHQVKSYFSTPSSTTSNSSSTSSSFSYNNSPTPAT